MQLEDSPITIGLLRLRRIDRKARRGPSQIPVTDLRCRVSLEFINPTVAHSIAKLFLLPPQY